MHGPNKEVHDQRLHQVLHRLEKEGLILNPTKCLFHKSRVNFLGHVTDSNGIMSDPRKTEAIQKMPPSTNLTELRRFMGMINNLNKFSPNITNLSQPLRELLVAWLWTEAHRKAFRAVKEEIASSRVLALYDV